MAPDLFGARGLSGEKNPAFRGWRSRHPYDSYVREYSRSNRFKINVKKILAYAVKRGRIVRPAVCSQCGEPCRPDGHHDDYTKPFSVRWLCRRCHVYFHRPDGAVVRKVRAVDGQRLAVSVGSTEDMPTR